MRFIREANEINDKISVLDRFIEIVDPEKNITRGSGDKDIGLTLKVNTKKSFSIFGLRWIGYNTRNSEIEIPNELVGVIQNLAIKMKLDQETELKNLLIETSKGLGDIR